MILVSTDPWYDQVNEERFIVPWASLSLVFMDMQERNSNSTSGGTKCGDGSTGNLCFKGSYCSAACVGGCLAAAGNEGSLCFTTCVWSSLSSIPEAGKQALFVVLSVFWKLIRREFQLVLTVTDVSRQLARQALDVWGLVIRKLVRRVALVKVVSRQLARQALCVWGDVF